MFFTFFYLWTYNPVHGILTLVGTGLCFSSFLLTYELDFSAFVVVLVYIGAVTILFIFVIMMINLRSASRSYIVLESQITTLFLGAAIFRGYFTVRQPGRSFYSLWSFLELDNNINLYEIGIILYGSELLILILGLGLILLVAMISAICLSLTSNENYRTQNYYVQIRRENSLFGFSNQLLDRKK